MKVQELFDVSGQVVLISGGCGLLGRTLVTGFSDNGAFPVIVDVASAQPAKHSAATSEHALGLAADVSDATQVADVVARTIERYGRIDVLINAHQYKPAGFLDAVAETFSEELWDAIIDVNLKGAFLLCRDVGRHMLERGSGSIINLASTYGIVSSDPGLYEDNSMGNPLAYSVSKSGIVMLTRYLGVHWAARGVRVNCVAPHGVWNNHEVAFEQRFSRRSPMGRMSQADEVLGIMLYLASGASSYVTGAVELVEGGWTAW